MPANGKPETDESKLLKAAEKQVAKLTRASRLHWAAYVLLIALVVMLGIVVVRGRQLTDTVKAEQTASAQIATRELQAQKAAIQGQENYVRLQLQHECTALELLTEKPVSPTITHKFYVALLYWEHSDGCRP